MRCFKKGFEGILGKTWDLEIWRFGDLGIWGFGDLEIWGFGDLERREAERVRG